MTDRASPVRMKRPAAARRRPRLAVGTLAVVALASCSSGNPGRSAEALIAGRLADEIGLGELTATCDQPADLETGETFECTATTPDGDTIEFVGELIGDDEFNVQTTNLLTEDDVERILPPIADAVGAEVGAVVVASDITCPPGSIVLDDAGDFDCEIVDRDTGDLYTITIQTGGLAPGGGPQDLRFLIGDLVER